jgi:methionine-rich copper-binding protein CopC
VVVLLAGLLVWAPAAQAHVTVVGTTPAADAALDVAPARVEVRFDSGLLDIGDAIVVRSGDGRDISTGPVDLGRDSIAVAVDPAAGPGPYTVAFRVVSADGHEVSSSFAYTVEGPAPATTPASTPSPATSAPDPSPAASASAPDGTAQAAPDAAAAGSRWSPAVVGVIAALAVAGAALLALARRTRD